MLIIILKISAALLTWALAAWLTHLIVLNKINAKIIRIGCSVMVPVFTFVLLSGIFKTIKNMKSRCEAEESALMVAHESGFSIIEEYQEAKASGFNTKGEYGLYNQKKREEAEKAAEATKLLVTKKEKEEEENCQKDIQCWGDKKLLSASISCEPYIERQAKYSYEWTDKSFEYKFSHFRWKNKPKGIVTYIGDKIKFQNGFGAWLNFIYECDYDPANDAVLDVRVREGILDTVKQ